MNRFRLTIILAVMGMAALLLAQTAAAPPGTAPSLRIVSPKPGERLDQTFVHLQFEVTNPGATAQASPGFVIQLDGQDPIQTTETSRDFTGLAAGTHTISVALVDANQTPINGGQASVQFSVSASAPKPSPGQELPDGGSSLPLFSIIGFGVLVGGTISAMRTR